MEKDDNKPEQQKASGNAWLKYSGLGFQMIAIIGLGAWAGVKLDEKLALKIPVFTISLLLLAVIGAIYLAIKDLIKNNQ